jgi:hypothetical protein
MSTPNDRPGVGARPRCTATARSGDRCGRAPIPGGTVCHYHGGAAPQTKAAAEERLRALQEPALDLLEKTLRHLTDKVDETRDLGTGVRAVLGVLDRTGLGPHSSLTLGGSLMERLAQLPGRDIVSD